MGLTKSISTSLLNVQLKGSSVASASEELMREAVQSKTLAMCRYIQGLPMEYPNLFSLSRQWFSTPAKNRF